MTILLIELETKGHHLSSYLRSIVTELVKNKKKITFIHSLINIPRLFILIK
jgi:hypothetical protein